jgi:uncharacterized protein YfdQ (DUF2303 family)
MALPRIPHTPTPDMADSDVGAALEVALRLHGAQTGAIEPGQIAILPEGLRTESLKALHDEWLTRPERRRGTATFDELRSFIDHTNRFKDADSAIFAQRSETAPALQAVLDYHRAGPPETAEAARWCQHRSIHKPKIAEVWRTWIDATAKPLSQLGFATLIEDRILDIAPPPDADDATSAALISALGGRVATQTELLTIARGLRVKENVEVTNAQTIETGEVEIHYKTELRDTANKPLRIATCFSVHAPVFDGGPAYRLWIRIQIRREEGALIWTLKRWRPDLIVKHALDEMIETVRAETNLPVLIGAPE